MDINPIMITEKAIPLVESTKLGELIPGNERELFTEAVFNDGRKKLKPVIEYLQMLQDELNYETGDKDGGVSRFRPVVFLKNKLWKELEISLSEIFGFKNVTIIPSKERYVGKGRFTTRTVSVYTYCTWRYPIQGIVTDNGFYDKTKSIEVKMVFTLGMLKLLTAEELTACILHELGHNIDPAIVDIRYISANKISDYLVGRKTKQEVPDLDDKGFGFFDIIKFMAAAAFLPITMIVVFVSHIMKSLASKTKLLKIVKKIVSSDNKNFSMNKNVEAFADNFARMYGFGPELISALSKIDNYVTGEAGLSTKKSFFLREKERQRLLVEMIRTSIEDEHSTTITRAASLIKEYEDELKDPDMPEKTKKNIQEDMDRLKDVLNEYVNHKDSFIQSIRTMMYEEIKKKGNPDDLN